MNISAITQDKLGYIWVATMGCVSRYNGYEFKRFFFDSNNPESLSSNHVSTIFCASKGLIYIGTANGLDCYDNRTGKFLKLFPELRCVIYKILEHNGYIYFCTNIGLYRFDINNEIKKLEELGGDLGEKPLISNLFFDRAENLWCAFDYGGYCYKQLRHSFCHGWASGPTSWLTEYVLGIHVVEPGCKVVKIEPHLGDLKWVEGTFPTPMGVVKIRHEKMPDGRIKSKINAPKGVKIAK